MKDTKTLNNNSFTFVPLDGFISEYFNKTRVNYKYNLSGNNISCVLYKVDESKSTISEGATTLVNTIGKESPYRFMKITNVPLFNITTIDPTLNWTEDNGFGAEMRIECIAQPSNLAIQVNDYISLSDLSYRNLWRVVEAQPDSPEDIYYTKLVLVPTQYTEENISFQVTKRMSYLFESSAIIDENMNNNLNSTLTQLDKFYRLFSSKFYTTHGFFIYPGLLKSIEDDISSRYFSFELIPLEINVLNYFFKRFIEYSIITPYIQHDIILRMLFPFKDDDELVKHIFRNDIKVLYYFIDQLDNQQYNSTALANALVKVEDLRLDYSQNKYDELVKYFDNTTEVIVDKDFYNILQDTFKLIEKTEITIDPNAKNVTKIIANINKLINNVSVDQSDNNLVKSIFLFYLMRSIPFKSITFGQKKVTFGV